MGWISAGAIRQGKGKSKALGLISSVSALSLHGNYNFEADVRSFALVFLSALCFDIVASCICAIDIEAYLEVFELAAREVK